MGMGQGGSESERESGLSLTFGPRPGGSDPSALRRCRPLAALAERCWGGRGTAGWLPGRHGPRRGARRRLSASHQRVWPGRRGRLCARRIVARTPRKRACGCSEPCPTNHAVGCCPCRPDRTERKNGGDTSANPGSWAPRGRPPSGRPCCPQTRPRPFSHDNGRWASVNRRLISASESVSQHCATACQRSPVLRGRWTAVD